jgi:iron complex outermembrane receptor protein
MKSWKFAASAATAALCLMGSGIANAQDATGPASAPAPAASDPASDDGSQDIVVTAQLRKESGQIVPVSVTAIGSDTLNRGNVTSLQDLSGSVPSVVVSKSVSYGLAPIAIRGLGGPAGGGSLFTDQPVAVYVDGVYVPALGQSVSDFLDIDTLQVLRGPQGTLYGRNSTAGAILISSKRPSLSDAGGYATAQYGTFDDFKIAGALDLPIISDTLGIRVAAGHNSGGDWARNTVDGRKFGGGDSTSVRGTLRWRPSPGTTFDLIADHSQGTSHPATLPLSIVTLAPRGPTLGTVYVGDPYARRADFASAIDGRRVQITGPQFTKTRATDVTLYGDIDLGGVTLTTISGYRNFRVNGAQDVTPFATPPAATNTNTTEQRQKSFSQELRLGSSGSGPFKWTLGAYYFHQDTDAFINIVNLQGGPPVATGFGPTGPIFAGRPTGTTALFQAKQKVNSVAVFADTTYDITPQLSVTGGIRYSRDKKDATIDNNVRTITNTVLAAPVLSAGTCPSATLNCKRSYENISPRGVITFKPTNRNMLYASYSKGFNSGGFNNFGNVANPTDPTNPLENSSEKITSYEIGSKNDFFDRALRLNVSVFQTDYKELHIRQAVLTGGVAIVNVPHARVRGVEVESLIRPVEGLTLTINGSYLDGKILKGTLTSLPSNVGVIVLGQNQTVTNENVAGNRLTRSPKWQGYASLAYAIPAGFATITPSVTWRGQTKTYYLETNQNSDQYVAAGWSEVDVRLGIAGEENKWEVALFGRNVLDKRYISQIVPFTGFPIATLNTPRTWGANATFRF